MPDIVQIIVNQEIARMKQAGFSNVSVSRFTKTIESPYEEILLGNDMAIVEKITFDANQILDNNNLLMIAVSSPIGFQEEQFTNIDSLKGFVSKVKINFWTHSPKNHKAGRIAPKLLPIKVHFVRLSPSK